MKWNNKNIKKVEMNKFIDIQKSWSEMQFTEKQKT